MPHSIYNWKKTSKWFRGTEAASTRAATPIQQESSLPCRALLRADRCSLIRGYPAGYSPCPERNRMTAASPRVDVSDTDEPAPDSQRCAFAVAPPRSTIHGMEITASSAVKCQRTLSRNLSAAGLPEAHVQLCQASEGFFACSIFCQVSKHEKHEDGRPHTRKQMTFRSVADTIQGMMSRYSITELDLASCSIGLNDDDLDQLVRVLTLCATRIFRPSIRCLNLCGNGMGDKGAIKLAGLLKQCSTLEHLNLASNDIGDEGALELAAALRQSLVLYHLNLSFNRIEDRGAYQIASMGLCESIEHLDLSSNDLGQKGIGSLLGALCCCRKLSQLLLSGNEIGGNVGDRQNEWHVPLANPKKLVRLELAVTGLGANDAAMLVGALQPCSGLEYLLLGGNDLGVQGARHLATLLRRCSALVCLSIAETNIQAEGARQIADVLGHYCQRLAHLYLGSNAMGAEGAGALAQVLRRCPSIQCLDLCENGIGDEGVTSLAGALRPSSRLARLNLARNGVSAVGAAELARGLQYFESFSLDLEANAIGARGKAELETVGFRESGAEGLAGLWTKPCPLHQEAVGGDSSLS